MNDLRITVNELSNSQMMIQGFNLEGQRATGMIRLELTMGDLSTTSILHVIDLKTSYKLLLRRPWLHKHGLVASTLHRCLKYYRDGEKKINDDTKPFTKVESYFTDARFFEEGDPSKEMMPATISSIGKRSDEDIHGMINSGPSGNVKQSRPSKKEPSKPLSPLFKQAVVATSLVAPIFRYIPKTRRKNGEAPSVNAQLPKA